MNNYDEELCLLEIRDNLRKSYAKAAKPYIDQLETIHARRRPKYVIMTVEQAKELGIKGSELKSPNEKIIHESK